MRKIYILLFVFILIGFIIDLMTGSVAIPVQEIIRILWSGESDNQAWFYIIDKIRLPKALTAILVGCGLSVGGLQMQTLFRNPLAGPSELGITAGASLGVAAMMLSGTGAAGVAAIHQLGVSGSWAVSVMASLGAALVFMIVILIAGRLKDHVVMLIVGVMISTLTMSLISIWQYFSQPEQLQAYIFWTFGSLGGVRDAQLLVLAIIVTAGILLAFVSSKALNTLLLGEDYAQSMGLTIGRARLMILLSTSLLTGSITAFCGPVGFVGIAVPHIARSLVNTSDHRILIPATCLIGALVMLVCDILTQLPGFQAVLPINVVTALFGAPVVIWIIISRNNLRSSFL
jgi:iron complex transport system permease protein